jgi:hypothetical protein
LGWNNIQLWKLSADLIFTVIQFLLMNTVVSVVGECHLWMIHQMIHQMDHLMDHLMNQLMDHLMDRLMNHLMDHLMDHLVDHLVLGGSGWDCTGCGKQFILDLSLKTV